jgi:hypothetical protein
MSLTVLAVSGARSQNVNWKRALADATNHAQLNVGYDYGFTTGVGYSRSINLYRPILLGVEFSAPMGSTVFDDFKVRVGGEVQVVERDGFALSLRIASNFRRYQNGFVRSVGFGADFAAIAGFYSESWHVAGEFGFDKAIATHLLHSEVMRSNFPDIRDGWYVPTGGHYYYGLQGGAAVSEKVDLSLRLGQTKAQMNDKHAVLPYYFQLGVGTWF